MKNPVTNPFKEMSPTTGAQHPIGFSTKPLDDDEEALISDLTELAGNPSLNQSEIHKLMRERLANQRDEIIQALNSIVCSSVSNVEKEKLFMVLNTFWIHLSPLQFEELLSDIQENGDGTIDFKHLLLKIEGKRRLKYGLTISDRSKYGSQAPESLTIPGLELLLQSKVHANMKEIVRAFRMYDFKGNGTISRQNLKKVLDAFAVTTKWPQFNNMMRRYDPHHTGCVNFRDFLIHLGINVSKHEKRVPSQVTAATIFNWYVPFPDEIEIATRKHALKFNQTDPQLLGLPLDVVVDKFEDKIISNMDEIQKGFVTYDIVNSGLISLMDFRDILNYFVFPTSDSLFRDLLFKFKMKKVGTLIPWEKFLENVRLKALRSPSQQHLTVHRWDKDPHSAVWTKINGAEICKCGDLIHLQGPLAVKNILRQLRKFNIVPGPTTKKEFTINTRVGEKLMTRTDLKLFLGRRCCFFREKELKDLMRLLDPDHTNYISYNRFQTMFYENPIPFNSDDKNLKKNNALCKIADAPMSSKLEKKMADGCFDMNHFAPSFPDLSPEDALVKLRRRLHRNWSSVESAILARCHSRGGGYIYQEELKNIIDVMVMNLTTVQWQHLLHRLGISIGQVNGRFFLDAFTELDVEALDHWNRRVIKWLGDSPKVTIVHEDELEKTLHELMRKRGKDIHRDLAQMDKRSLGYVSKGMFHKMLVKYIPNLTEEQFMTLWSRLPTNDYCNVDYGCFLRRYKHYYDSVPGHRCECECEYALRDFIDNGSGDEQARIIDQRLLAGGALSDKDKIPEIKPRNGDAVKTTEHLRLRQPPPLLQPLEPQGTLPSTSKNGEAMTGSSISLISTGRSDHTVHVPFRPPTPPKQNHNKEPIVGPLILPKKHNNSARQSAGMDLKQSLKIDIPKKYEKLMDREEEPKDKKLYCSCHYRYKPKATSGDDFSPCSSCHLPSSAVAVVGSSERLDDSPEKENQDLPKSGPPDVKLVEPPKDVKTSSSKESSKSTTSRKKATFESKESKKEDECRLVELLKSVVNRYWREIRLFCNQSDTMGFGYVSAARFRESLATYGIPVNLPEMELLLRKYDVPESGPVNYLLFLQNFVIHLRAEPVKVLDRRSPTPSFKLGTPSAGLYDTLLSIRAPVLAHFTELRRVLRSQDKTGRGWIHAIEFRKFLTHFNLPLSDERFFFLMEYFDPNLTGHISYNEFLRVFTSAR